MWVDGNCQDVPSSLSILTIYDLNCIDQAKVVGPRVYVRWEPKVVDAQLSSVQVPT